MPEAERSWQRWPQEAMVMTLEEVLDSLMRKIEAFSETAPTGCVLALDVDGEVSEARNVLAEARAGKEVEHEGS
jgi:hypothetical protein